MRTRRSATTLDSEMRTGLRDKLIDVVMDAYIEWRQASADLEFAYQRWSLAPSADRASAYAVAAAALDREERAAIFYADEIRAAVRLLSRHRRRRSEAARRSVGVRRSRRRRRTGSLRRSAGPRGTGGGSARSGGRAR
jgi:hypothetical protein